jgi:hypothetical protein
MKKRTQIIALIAFSWWGAAANASLIGDELVYGILAFPSLVILDLGEVQIGPGVEVDYTGLGNGSSVSFDFTADTLTLVFDLGDVLISTEEDVIWGFFSSDWGSDPPKIANVIQTGGPDALEIRVDVLFFEITTSRFDFPTRRNTYTFDIDLADDVAAPVPTPATLTLFGLGLATLGWSRRKKA